MSLRPMITTLDLWSGAFMEVPAPNFSYDEIPSGCCMRIYQYQQMFVYRELTIHGTVVNHGEIILR